jgi:nucleotide-binding universal stress UspA family protein
MRTTEGPGPEFQSLAVPVDGSDFAEQALPLATRIALATGARVGLLLVHRPPAVPLASGAERAYAALDRQVQEAEVAYLQRLARRLEDAGMARVEAAVLSGPVADALEAEIERSGTDLVVMSTHGRGGLGRFWLGSVADRLLHGVTVPLLLVRPTAGAAPSPAGIERIIVPLDGSPLAQSALEPAAALAVLFGAELHLIRVIPPTFYVAAAVDMPYAYDPALDATLEREATEHLAAQATALRSRGLRVATQVDRNPVVARAVLDAAEAGSGAIVCLATHGRAGAGRVFLGSVADKLVRGASCPVLVWRSPAR